MEKIAKYFYCYRFFYDILPIATTKAKSSVLYFRSTANKNCLFKQFEMDRPRDLLAKLPKDSKYYNFFDAADSFDSIKLHPNDIAYTAFEIPKPEGGNEFIANSRIPQGALNSSGTLVETYRSCITVRASQQNHGKGVTSGAWERTVAVYLKFYLSSTRSY